MAQAMMLEQVERQILALGGDFAAARETVLAALVEETEQVDPARMDWLIAMGLR